MGDLWMAVGYYLVKEFRNYDVWILDVLDLKVIGNFVE